MDNEKLKLLNLWAMIRWFMVVVLFSIGLLHISFSDTIAQNIIFFAVFGGIVALNLLFQVQSHAPNQWVVAFQVILDIVFATIVVHLTGGLNSFFVWVYLIGVITAALTIRQNGGLLAGLTGSVSLLTLILLYQNGIMTPTESSNLDAAGSTVYILSYTGLFCGVAMIANYLSDQLAYQRNLEKELTANLAKLNECFQTQKQLDDLLPILKDVAGMDHDINTPLCVITLSLGRVKRYANQYQNEGLHKSNNEIMEAVNKISLILQRLHPMKLSPLLNYYNKRDFTQYTCPIPEKEEAVKTPFNTDQMEQSKHDNNREDGTFKEDS
ncbi:MAG: histidine kinase [Candidatus Cloacimonetes bacterium]|nr:histidine kinase [Candidatus Cloacimonadota bacterium]